MPNPKSRMEVYSELKIGRKEAHDTSDPWPHIEVERLKVAVSRLFDATVENAPYLPKGRPTNFKLGRGMEYDDLHNLKCAMMSKVKGQGNKVMSSVSCSPKSFPGRLFGTQLPSNL